MTKESKKLIYEFMYEEVMSDDDDFTKIEILWPVLQKIRSLCRDNMDIGVPMMPEWMVIAAKLYELDTVKLVEAIVVWIQKYNTIQVQTA